MTTIITEIYDALIEAGASEEKARKAAEAATGVDVDKIATELTLHRIDLVKIATELTFHRWAFGLIAALQIAILVKLLIMH